VKILKNVVERLEFTSCSGEHHVFSFRGRPRNIVYFFFSWN